MLVLTYYQNIFHCSFLYLPVILPVAYLDTTNCEMQGRPLLLITFLSLFICSFCRCCSPCCWGIAAFFPPRKITVYSVFTYVLVDLGNSNIQQLLLFLPQFFYLGNVNSRNSTTDYPRIIWIKKKNQLEMYIPSTILALFSRTQAEFRRGKECSYGKQRK